MPEREEAEQLFRIIKRRIVEIRVKKNLTQEKLAQIMEVEPRTIQRWEGKKEKRLTLWALCRLSIAFECPIKEFFIEDQEAEKKKGFYQKYKKRGGHQSKT